MREWTCMDCGKIILFPKHTFEDGVFLCDRCNENLEALEKKLIKKILSNKTTYKLLENFIDKYNGNYEQNKVENIQRLLDKKYNIYIRGEAIYGVIEGIEDEINEDRKLRKFEINLKYHKEKTFYCSKCKKEITRGEFNYSMDRYDKALCIKHQNWEKATTHAKKLYNALVERGINCELESSDGHKSVDISIPEAKLNIEVDGKQHITDSKQFVADLKRDSYSNKNGFVTKRIPNYFIDTEPDKTADSIAEAVKTRIIDLK